MDGDGGGADAGGAGAMGGMDGDGEAAMNGTNGDRPDSVLESMGYTVDGSAGTAGSEGEPGDSGTSTLEYALVILGFLAVVFLLILLYI